ncbi:hypothetical protein B0T17DRAFT_613777 [Bombardia bombarda]|uniref:Membrane-associated protein n=1 Tax=Bombardia bombarda TaxID=252184 RepID=A0AA40CG99_9PEZI|nr:hypothetical protein B0T17DRAFT_613777 [Bombardia bombarda]
MRKRGVVPFGLLLGLLTCLTLSTAAAVVNDNDAATRVDSSDGIVVEQAREREPEQIRVWQQHRPEVMSKRRRVTNRGQHPISTPVLSIPTSLSKKTTAPFSSSAACPMTTAAAVVDFGIRRRDAALVTISSLSSALASANASAVLVSRDLASSVTKLQSSADDFAASASSALESASSALESASSAVAAAEESAASSVSSALARASAIRGSATSIIGQATNALIEVDTDLQAIHYEAMSVTRAAIAIVASIIGSSLLSLLGFYIFVCRRKARRKQAEEEQTVNDALDRAIVSYIVKEQDQDPSAANAVTRVNTSNSQMAEVVSSSAAADTAAVAAYTATGGDGAAMRCQEDAEHTVACEPGA